MTKLWAEHESGTPKQNSHKHAHTDRVNSICPSAISWQVHKKVKIENFCAGCICRCFRYPLCDWCFQLGKLNDYLSGKDLFIRFTIRVVFNCCQFMYIFFSLLVLRADMIYEGVCFILNYEVCLYD